MKFDVMWQIREGLSPSLPFLFPLVARPSGAISATGNVALDAIQLLRNFGDRSEIS
jgi:hypothetical protein